MRKRKYLTAALTLLVSQPACAAATLLDIIDPAGQLYNPYTLAFVANASSVTLLVRGYQLPSFLFTTENRVILSGGDANNLLQRDWSNLDITGLSYQGFDPSDQSGVNALVFGSFEGGDVGVYDTFAQTFATTPGATYNYTFLFSNDEGPFSNPSGFRVEVENAIAAVPEPSTWIMLLIGFGLTAAALRRRPCLQPSRDTASA